MEEDDGFTVAEFTTAVHDNTASSDASALSTADDGFATPALMAVVETEVVVTTTITATTTTTLITDAAETTSGTSVETSPNSVHDDQQLPATKVDDAAPLSYDTSVTVPSTAALGPPVVHWMYKASPEDWGWTHFSKIDSNTIENAMLNGQTTAMVFGGRYDVNLTDMLLVPVYWNGPSVEIRRGSWFYSHYQSGGSAVPFPEKVAQQLEHIYQDLYASGQWGVEMVMDDTHSVVFHSPSAILYYKMDLVEMERKAQVVRRGFEFFASVETGDSRPIGNLMLVIHGIGVGCDIRLRDITLCVNDMRHTVATLMESHFPNKETRCELLPVQWHSSLHDGLGMDKKLQSITLTSIPTLRNFVNDTILDALFFAGFKYRQGILTGVAEELNRLVELFNSRNPGFNGKVIVVGHSLGSVIAFDILAAQPAPEGQNSAWSAAFAEENALLHVPKLNFNPSVLVALGSPIALYLTLRGADAIPANFQFPTCPGFYHVFHPHDPVAYRIEPLCLAAMGEIKPEQVSHYKGGKRMHIQVREGLSEVTEKVKKSALSTWSVFSSALSIVTGRGGSTIESENGGTTLVETSVESTVTEDAAVSADTDRMQTVRLNQGRRIDYALQEATFEAINEYVSSIGAHLAYWKSEDVNLFLLNVLFD